MAGLEAAEAAGVATAAGLEAVELAEVEEAAGLEAACVVADTALPAGAASGTAAVVGFGTLIKVSVLLPDPLPLI